MAERLSNFKSHDVRRMHACQVCQQVGIYQPNGLTVPTLLQIYKSPDPRRHQHHFVHPRCYVNRNGIAALLALPTLELGEICMSDLTKQQIKAVISVLKTRRDEAAAALEHIDG
jgi:hypothetical protein